MKTKFCVATVSVKVNHMFQNERYGLAISKLSDRKSTIKLLKRIENGNWWQDLAWDYVYVKRIVPKKIEIKSEKQMIDYLLKTNEKKWESFVRVFTPKGQGMCEIKTIEFN